MKLHELLAGSEVVDRCEDCLDLRDYGSGIRVCRFLFKGSGVKVEAPGRGVGCRA